MKVAIIGGGPAGLTAAYALTRNGKPAAVRVFEADRIVGGIARTENYKGFRFDIGGHRFFTKIPEIEALWHEILGADFIKVRRLSRIYYRGQYYDYPLRLFGALRNIGIYETARIVLSYAKWKVRPSREETSFEQWVINRFGGRLYMHFFRSYTKKVWGIDPKQIQADWAAQRIKNLSLWGAVRAAITGRSDATSLIEEFQYPRLGPGMMWERAAERIEANGGRVESSTEVTRVIRDGARVKAIEIRREDGSVEMVHADQFISTMALRDLIRTLTPAPPDEVVAAAERLRYRDFLIVTLIIDKPDPFPDNWIYIHSPEVFVGRIQNFRAWSSQMVPNDRQASIGMEYFCQAGDGLWSMSDDDLIKLASKELEKLGLAWASDVSDGAVIRQPKAYPVYDPDYREAVETVSNWLKTLTNFQTVGRNGLHRYNNQDHSMLTALYAVRNIEGENLDLWNVNVDRAYHEDFQRTA